MKREEAMQILQLYKDELEQRIDEADAPDVKDVYRWQMDGFGMAIEALKAEPIRCGECENYIDRRCIEANHHVAAHGNCMNVFGAKRREL